MPGAPPFWPDICSNKLSSGCFCRACIKSATNKSEFCDKLTSCPKQQTWELGKWEGGSTHKKVNEMAEKDDRQTLATFRFFNYFCRYDDFSLSPDMAAGSR